MTATSRSVVMVGELPEPFGGVALHCYHTCQELARLGVEVHLLDSAPSAMKHLPPLASYRRLTKRYVRGGFAALRSPRLIRSWIVVVVPVAHRIGLRAALQALVLSHRTYEMARLAGTRSIVAHHAGERGLAAQCALCQTARAAQEEHHMLRGGDPEELRQRGAPHVAASSRSLWRDGRGRRRGSRLDPPQRRSSARIDERPSR